MAFGATACGVTPVLTSRRRELATGRSTTDNSHPLSCGWLEPPLSNEERPERARRRDVLISRQTRLSKDVSRINTGLETVALSSAKSVHDLHAWPHQRFRIERRFHRDESVRLDVLPELELRRAQEVADIRLHVGGRDGEEIRAKRARRAAGDLVGGDTESYAGELAAGQCGTSAHEVGAATAV